MAAYEYAPPPAKFFQRLIVPLLTALLALAVCGGALATSPPVSATVVLTNYASFEEACNAAGISDCSAVTDLKITGQTTGGEWTTADGKKMAEKFTSLKKLDMEDYTGKYGASPFLDCTFSHVRLPENGIISDYMFHHCGSLTTLAFGSKPYNEGVIDLRDYTGTSYGFSAFRLSGVTQVRLPDHIPISGKMFWKCDNLTTLAVGDQTFTSGVIDLTGYTATSYGDSAFTNSAITQVRLPASVPLSSHMFWDCHNLTTLAVGNQTFTPGVIDLRGYTAPRYGDSAFKESRITQVRLPANIPISDSMFFKCDNLTTLAVGDQTFTSGVIDLTGYTAPSYGESAFEGSRFTQVRLPANIPIGKRMFTSCSKLTTLAVGDQTFTSGVIDLTGYTAASYGEYAFDGGKFTQVRLPVNVPLSYRMFAWCYNLTTLIFIGGNAPNGTDQVFLSVPNEDSCTLYYPIGATGYGANEFHPKYLSNWRRVPGVPVPSPVVPPKTGDSAQPLLWFSLCALALAGATGLGIMNKRRRVKGR